MHVIAIDNGVFVLSGLTRTIKKVVSSNAVVKGFRVPTEALQYARDHPVDVAFLDVEISQMHGLILAKKLQQLNPKVNIIFVSATNDYGIEAWDLHASGYLRKPVSSERIEREFSNLRYAAEAAE